MNLNKSKNEHNNVYLDHHAILNQILHGCVIDNVQYELMDQDSEHDYRRGQSRMVIEMIKLSK